MPTTENNSWRWYQYSIKFLSGNRFPPSTWKSFCTKYILQHRFLVKFKCCFVPVIDHLPRTFPMVPFCHSILRPSTFWHNETDYLWTNFSSSDFIWKTFKTQAKFKKLHQVLEIYQRSTRNRFESILPRWICSVLH